MRNSAPEFSGGPGNPVVSIGKLAYLVGNASIFVLLMPGYFGTVHIVGTTKRTFRVCVL